MAFKVIIDGKPCAGKTTISREVEARLPDDYGISALDAKSYALEKGFLSGLLRKFAESEVDTYKALAYSGVRHGLSYLALEESAWKNKKKYDVLLLQRSPYSFSFMLEAVKSVSGDAGGHEISGLVYSIIRGWASTVKPDLFIYLTADVETLRERFKNRAEGRDRIHARMIEEDDSRHIKLLRGYVGSNFKVIDSASSLEESVKAVESSIYKAYSEQNPVIRPAPSKGSMEKA